METKKIICDTDVMIDFFDENKKRHLVTKKIIEEVIGIDNVVISAVTKMEMMVGATNKMDLRTINKKLQRFHIALINDNISVMAFELIEKYYLSHGLVMPDGLIASTAIITNLELFSYNIKDYKFIKDLKLFKIDNKDYVHN